MDETADTLISVQDLYKEYKVSKYVTVPALNGVSFEVSRGEFLAINGSSGSGKTTLLNLLGLLDDPTGGKIIINGNDTQKLSEKEKNKFRLQSVGFIFQFFNLIENYTAVENIIFQLKLQRLSGSEAKSRAQRIIDFLGLKDRASFFPRELSGGEQQRVAIGRALAKDSLIILVDEPTAHLDLENGRMVIDFLKKANKVFHRTMILVTHEREEAQSADRIITLRDGKLVGNEKNRFYSRAQHV